MCRYPCQRKSKCVCIFMFMLVCVCVHIVIAYYLKMYIFTHMYIIYSKLARADIQGRSSHYVEMLIDIWDTRVKTSPPLIPMPASATEHVNTKKFKYTITVTRGTNKLSYIYQKIYTSPGRYTLTIPMRNPDNTLLVIRLVDEHGIYHEDSVYVNMNTRFYIWIKYMLVLPVLLLCVPLLLMKHSNNNI